MTNILTIGSGGREHALVWKLAQSSDCGQIYASPGNPGISAHAKCLHLEGAKEIIDFCREKEIGLVVVGPEQPLVDGLEDALYDAGIPCFGPSRAGAQLEGSKAYTKELCREYAIPTASFATFRDRARARAYIADKPTPIVVKADGLAAGKGVIVAESQEDALQAVDKLLAISPSIVIEECLQGEEVSVFCITDGRTVLPLTTAQDHKRAYDGDQGPNTGGMGAYSPAPVLGETGMKDVLDQIIYPTIKALEDRKIRYRGVLYAGLMMTAEGPKLIEYNCRFGDPECQVLMIRMTSDLLPLLLVAARGELDQAEEVTWSDEQAITVVMASEGYPNAPRTGTQIAGLSNAAECTGIQIFHAGTNRVSDKLLSAGGRVLNICATAPSLEQARKRVYDSITRIDWPHGFYRKDIGWRVLDAADDMNDLK